MKATKLQPGIWAVTLFVFLLTAPLVLGGPQEQSTADSVEKEFREALQALKKYTAEQRDQAVERLKAAMEALDAEIDKLHKKFERDRDRMDKTAREKANKSLQTLRKKSNDLARRYDALKHSSADAWEKVKKGFAESYEVLSKNIEDAGRELDKGPASK